MNLHAQPERLGQPPLTPAERVEALIDAITLYEMRRREAENWLDAMTRLGERRLGDPQTTADRAWHAELIERQFRAREELVARAKTLMADGLLERCAEILRAETAGCP